MEKIEVTQFGTTPAGEIVNSYILKNKKGVALEVLSYGGIVRSLRTPDRNGKFNDIVLGLTTLDDYIQKNSPYFGAIIGRVGNRIANGRFIIEGNEYQVAQNIGDNHLHGGGVGFDSVVWKVEDISSHDSHALKLTYLSKDGEEGYPGNLKVDVVYRLTNDNAFEITYHATTDKTTVINLTHHSYFNLNLSSGENILNHVVQLLASQFIPVNENSIPTGELAPVENSPFDFRVSKKVGAEIDSQHTQLIFGKGYDHCWVVDDRGNGVVKIATVYDPISGRNMEVWTTEPGVQFYTGNFLDGTIVGKENQKYDHRMGLCLETQHFPDAPNHTSFPTVILKADEEYNSKTIYRFDIQ